MPFSTPQPSALPTYDRAKHRERYVREYTDRAVTGKGAVSNHDLVLIYENANIMFELIYPHED
jgi:hypothetical protein